MYAARSFYILVLLCINRIKRKCQHSRENTDMARYLSTEGEWVMRENCNGIVGAADAAFVERYLVFSCGYKPLGDRPRFANVCSFSIGVDKKYEAANTDDEVSADDALADGDFYAYRYFMDRANENRPYTVNPRFTIYPSHKSCMYAVDVYDGYFIIQGYEQKRDQGPSVHIDNYHLETWAKRIARSKEELLPFLDAICGK